MSECPTCSYPLIWSIDRERVICSVYGDHAHVAAQPSPPSAAYPFSPGADLIRLVMGDDDPRTAAERRTDRHRAGQARRRLKAVS